MAKRLTDSRKWDDPWFLELPNTHRLIWLYILDKCNHAGIYKHSDKMMMFFIEGADWKEFLRVSVSRVKHVEKDKYFIPKFIEFQYGELNESVNCHKSVIAELKKLRVDELFLKGCSTLKDKDKSKDKVKESFKKPNIDEIRAYCKERNNKVDPECFIDFYEAKGWVIGKNKMKDWKASVRTWEKHQQDTPESKPRINPTEYDKMIQGKLDKMATKDMVLALMKKIPENMWWKIDAFLKKRYPGGGNSYIEAESQMLREKNAIR